MSTAAKAFYFEDFCLGQTFDTESFTLEKQAMIDFAQQWDPQPFHIDEQAARQSIFGQITACSAHIFSIYCAIAPKWKQPVQLQVLAGLGFDGLKMHLPVYAGDTLTCLIKVEQLRRSQSKPDRGIVTHFCQLMNQRQECVFEIYATALVSCRTLG